MRIKSRIPCVILCQCQPKTSCIRKLDNTGKVTSSLIDILACSISLSVANYGEVVLIHITMVMKDCGQHYSMFDAIIPIEHEVRCHRSY